MKIAAFTEGGWSGKTPRNHPNMRTDLAWWAALNADHYSINGAVEGDYDLGIIIIPKKNVRIFVERGFERVMKYCKKVAIMQEGPNWYWQDWDVETQIMYINCLSTADYIFCHNESDRKYYSGLLDTDNVHVLSTLMIEDAINKDLLNKQTIDNPRKGVMVGGNFVSWYGGFDSYMIAAEFDGEIYAPSMGRKQAGEDHMAGINYLPYMNWQQWIGELSKRKYAVHLMRTHAAGTFALNCAYLGIPCIGWKGLDTQEICFPKLTFEVGDMKEARRMAKHLATNEQFYKHVSVVARSMYDEYFSEEHFLDRFKDIFKS